MVDLRYFALTLIAVFLALAIGLMAGSALGGPDKREAAYDRLREQFELLRTENQRVRDESELARRRLASRDQALRLLLPQAVRGRLSGTRVAILVCGGGDTGRYWSDLEATLQAAGAQTGIVVRVPDELKELNDDQRREFARLWGADPLPGAPGPFQAAAWLVHGLAQGGPLERLQVLARATGMEARGLENLPVRRLLIVSTGGPGDRAGATQPGAFPEIAAADAARAEQMVVVGAEAEDALPGVADLLGRRNITTVDNVDTFAGQIAAVLALVGAEGRFGSKAGATQAIPSPEHR